MQFKNYEAWERTLVLSIDCFIINCQGNPDPELYIRLFESSPTGIMWKKLKGLNLGEQEGQ